MKVVYAVILFDVLLFFMVNNYDSYRGKGFAYFRYLLVNNLMSKGTVQALMGTVDYPQTEGFAANSPFVECWDYDEMTNNAMEYKSLRICFDKQGKVVKKLIAQHFTTH